MKNAVASDRSAKESARTAFCIFIDGAGMGPFGTGSGYAWVEEDTGEQFVTHRDGLTNNEAEYRALLSALKHLPSGAEADIYSDSQLIVNQFNREWVVRDPNLRRLLGKVRALIREGHLKVTLSWVPRERNLAGPLLDRKRPGREKNDE